MSQLKPRLDADNIRLVGIGLEELGVEDFVKGEYFKGELYIDMKKECYKELGFRRLNVLSMIGKLVGKSTRQSLKESREQHIDGNFKGDGMQNGGALVVDQGGAVLLSWKQDSPGEHLDPNNVLKSLGITETVQVDAAKDADCDSGACALPQKAVPS